MSSDVGSTPESLVWCSLLGITRGVSVHTLIYPLEVVKIRQQCSLGSKSFRVASALLREEGIGAFYKGLTSQLLKTSIKQVWCWPMIAGMPSFFQRYKIEKLQQQALTGLSISTVDAAISTPLERIKIRAASGGTSNFRLKNAYRDGWKGFGVHWSKLSVSWVTFMTAQKHFRDQTSGHPLSFPELSKIGIQVALTVSLVSAPFDLANTLKQAKNLSPSHLFSRRGNFKLYQGWPLNALSLVIHNIASVTLIEKLGYMSETGKTH